MELSTILSSFTKAKQQLTEFVEHRSAANDELRKKLDDGSLELAQANKALRQATKLTGK